MERLLQAEMARLADEDDDDAPPARRAEPV
jgi:hypothetical protein